MRSGCPLLSRFPKLFKCACLASALSRASCVLFLTLSVISMQARDCFAAAAQPLYIIVVFFLLTSFLSFFSFLWYFWRCFRFSLSHSNHYVSSFFFFFFPRFSLFHFALLNIAPHGCMHMFIAKVCKLSDVFALPSVGPCGTYVNPHGHVHRTLTVRSVNDASLRLQGPYSTESSWFPGMLCLASFSLCICRESDF